MNLKHRSIFNLIEIFTTKRVPVIKAVNIKKHCEHNQLSDFYCDSEKSNELLRSVGINL